MKAKYIGEAKDFKNKILTIEDFKFADFFVGKYYDEETEEIHLIVCKADELQIVL